MIVMKFGGTSVESAAAIERIAGIVRARFNRQPLVVVSAMGKTTNRLLAAADKAAAGNLGDALRDAEDLHAFHRREAGAAVPRENHPAMDALLENHFEELEGRLQRIAAAANSPRALWDEVCSYGERISSALVALAFPGFGIPAAHVDARSVLITDGRHTRRCRSIAAPTPASRRRSCPCSRVASSSWAASSAPRGRRHHHARPRRHRFHRRHRRRRHRRRGDPDLDRRGRHAHLRPARPPGGHRVKRSPSTRPPNSPTSAPRCCTRPPCCPPSRRISRCDPQLAPARSRQARASSPRPSPAATPSSPSPASAASPSSTSAACAC